MKLIFAGTPEFAAIILRGLYASGQQIDAVYTQPDRAAGRGRKLRASPVKEVALAHHSAVLQPVSLRDDAEQQVLREHRPDVMVVAAYGLILPPAVLAIPRLGCINVHASLLPRWRGAAPIQRAIEAGDSYTGVCIMRMEKGLDTGPVLAERRLAIGAHDTAGEIHDALAPLGRDLLIETLTALEQGSVSETAQDDSLATYAHRFDKSDARVDWSRDAVALERQIRAFTPTPGAWTEMHANSGGNPLRLRILRATLVDTRHADAVAGEVLCADGDQLVVACGRQALALHQVQMAGKRAVSAAEFNNARSLLRGDRLQ